MGIFNKFKKNKKEEMEKIKETVDTKMNNELNEDDLFNIAGGMNYSPEEAKKQEELIKDMVNPFAK